MTELDPNQSPPEPNAEDMGTEADRPVDAENTPTEPDGPPPDEAQVDSEAVADEPSETIADEATETVSDQATETVSGEATETVTVESTETVTDEATETVPDEAIETVTVESTETVTGEATETVADEATETVADEATETVADEATETVTGEATETVADEATETVADEATQPVADESTEDLANRALTVNGEASAEPEAEAPASTPPPRKRTNAAVSDDTSDVASIPDEPTDDPESATSQLRVGDWQAEMSAHRIAVELKRLETRIRELLADRDSRRKRKLAGTYRWHELEEDIIGWRAERRIDSATLDELHQLVCQRHFLFNQLRFAASTRPTWNS